MKGETERALFHLLQIALTNSSERQLPDKIEWEDLFEIVQNQGVAALVTDGLQRIIDSQKDGNLFQYLGMSQLLLYNMIGVTLALEDNCKKQYQYAAKLSELWHENGIRTLVLKGMAFGSYYPNPYHRPCVDMDCYLIRANDNLKYKKKLYRGMGIRQ